MKPMTASFNSDMLCLFLFLNYTFAGEVSFFVEYIMFAPSCFGLCNCAWLAIYRYRKCKVIGRKYI